jgi:hypothetical protein
MGYCINQTEQKFTIEKKNIQPAWNALKDFFTKKGDLSWVNASQVLKATFFEDALSECRWGIRTDATSGDICDIYFEGEKLGEDEKILNAIAPYVERGSFIGMSGEDNLQWRWVFDGQTCTELDADIDYVGYRDMVLAILKQKKILPTLIGIHPGLDAKIHEAMSK